MYFQNPLASGFLMQAIHVLCNESQAGYALLQFCQSKMSGIWSSLIDDAATPVIPLPDGFRIPGKCLWGGQTLGTKLIPKPRSIRKGGTTSSGRAPCTSKNRNGRSF